MSPLELFKLKKTYSSAHGTQFFLIFVNLSKCWDRKTGVSHGNVSNLAENHHEHRNHRHNNFLFQFFPYQKINDPDRRLITGSFSKRKCTLKKKNFPSFRKYTFLSNFFFLLNNSVLRKSCIRSERKVGSSVDYGLRR